MTAYAISTTVQGVSASGAGTITEEFVTTITLAASASDISLTLGGITDPKYVIVVGGTGCSFKIGAGGADAIGCNPFGAFCDPDGLSETIVLLSNSDGQSQAVTIYAGE